MRRHAEKKNQIICCFQILRVLSAYRGCLFSDGPQSENIRLNHECEGGIEVKPEDRRLES